MTAVRFLAALVVTVFLAQAALAEPPRTTWSYEGGYMKDNGGGKWIERGATANYNFKEVSRNADYIELMEADGKTGHRVRLYATQGYTKDTTEKEFRSWTKGKWNE